MNAKKNPETSVKVADAVARTLRKYGARFAFGIPGTVALIRFLPLVVDTFAVALAVMTVLQWFRRLLGSTRDTIFISAVAVAGLFVSGWLLTLGFLP